MTAHHKAVDAVKQRFLRWVGHPAPMKPFQSHWCDVDAMAAHVVALEAESDALLTRAEAAEARCVDLAALPDEKMPDREWTHGEWMRNQLSLCNETFVALEAERDALRTALEKYEPKATHVSAWFMHDTHCFARLTGTIDDMIAQAREIIASPEGACGSLCPLKVMAKSTELRRIGPMVSYTRGDYRTLDETQLAEWRSAALADTDVVRLTALDLALAVQS